MKVTITEAAWDGMLGICRTIGSDSPRRAEAFLEELYEHCVGLADMPAAFPLTSGYESRGIRRRIFGKSECRRQERSKLHTIHHAPLVRSRLREYPQNVRGSSLLVA